MEDFFKQFRENLEHRPVPDFDERDWQDMRARLDRAGRKHPTAGAWWWLVLSFLLLASTNTFFFWQWKKAAQQISALEIRRDTVCRTSVVYIRDTVYHNRAIKMPAMLFWASQAERGTVSDQFDGTNQLTTIPLENKESMLTEPPLQSVDLLPHRKPQLLRRHPILVAFGYRLTPVTAQKRRKPLLTRIYEARPKSFQIGINGSWLYPFGEGLDYRSGNSLGGQFTAAFSPRLQMWADVAYSESRFVAERMGDDIGVPVVAPPSDQYVFSRAEVPQPFWQFSAGLQYFFRTERRLQPFLGLGYGAVSLQPYDVGYEFRHVSLGIEWDFDKTEDGSGQLTDFGLFRAGLQFRVSKRWNAQIRADYRSDFGKPGGVRPPDVLGLGFGLNYGL